MKTTKRILSALLCLALALALVIPAFAAGGGETPQAPVITKQPLVRKMILTGDTLTLTVEAKLPEGAVGELQYQWYEGTREFAKEQPFQYAPIADATQATLMVTPAVKLTGAFSVEEHSFYVAVFYTVQTGEADEVTLLTKSNTTYLVYYPTVEDLAQIGLTAIGGDPNDLLLQGFVLLFVVPFLFLLSFPMAVALYTVNIAAI
ncbi:MAG: hypothetical protein LBS96_00480 [Oscillospiraceae bacterium]|jgi:hypothetical protein|nr:hypothetical protein [Oscillospiraceae bacterium]